MLANNRIVYLVLFLSVLIDTIGDGLIMPLVPFYGLKFGAAPSTVTLLFSVYSLTQLVTAPFWGIMSDRFGRRPMLLLSLIGSGFAYLWLSQATALWMLFVCRILEGTMAVSFLLATVYICDITTKENRTKSMGIIGAASGLGFCFGPGLSGLLVGSDANNPNFMLPCLVAACMSLIGFIIAWFTLPESKPAHLQATTRSQRPSFNLASLSEMFQPPPTGLLLLSTFLIMFALMGMFTIFPIWIQQKINWGPKEIGYVYVLWGVLCVTVQSVVVGPLCKRYGEANLLFWGALLTGFGLFIMPFSTNVPLVLGALVLQVIGFYTCRPAVLNSLLSQAAGAKQQAKTLSFAGAIAAFASIISPVWSGFIFGSLGSSWPFLTGAIAMLITSILAWQVATSSRLSSAISLQRQRKMKRMFDVLDFDKNGFIEPIDFEESVKIIAEIRGLQVDSPDYWLIHSFWTGLGAKLQNLMDADGDGRITPEEWLEYMGRRIDGDLADAFLQLIDSNADGKIILDELKMFYQAYKIDADSIKDAFETLDLNKDGHISPEEMRIILDQFMYSDDNVPGNLLLGKVIL